MFNEIGHLIRQSKAFKWKLLAAAIVLYQGEKSVNVTLETYQTWLTRGCYCCSRCNGMICATPLRADSIFNKPILQKSAKYFATYSSRLQPVMSDTYLLGFFF